MISFVVAGHTAVIITAKLTGVRCYLYIAERISAMVALSIPQIPLRRLHGCKKHKRMALTALLSWLVLKILIVLNNRSVVVFATRFFTNFFVKKSKQACTHHEQDCYTDTDTKANFSGINIIVESCFAIVIISVADHAGWCLKIVILSERDVLGACIGQRVVVDIIHWLVSLSVKIDKALEI